MNIMCGFRTGCFRNLYTKANICTREIGIVPVRGVGKREKLPTSASQLKFNIENIRSEIFHIGLGTS